MNDDLFPSSSNAERRIKNGDGASQASSGATTFCYAILRDDLSGGALLAHFGHAMREAKGPAPTEDERIGVLMATKAQIEKLCTDLTTAGIPFKACVEVDGPLAGSTPSIGFSILLKDKDLLKPILGHLKVWRK